MSIAADHDSSRVSSAIVVRARTRATASGCSKHSRIQFVRACSPRFHEQASTEVAVTDVVATGGNGVKADVFMLGTNNVVSVTYKLGNASSYWSSWTALA